jgi:mRNA-degrading endonuclease RelE of RelBE toxin-antitoxin system
MNIAYSKKFLKQLAELPKSYRNKIAALLCHCVSGSINLHDKALAGTKPLNSNVNGLNGI